MSQLQGAPCWQPQTQVDGAAAWVWQPQVQAAPGQDLQEQDLESVFMSVFLSVSADRSWPAKRILGNVPAGVLNVWADPGTGCGE